MKIIMKTSIKARGWLLGVWIGLRGCFLGEIKKTCCMTYWDDLFQNHTGLKNSFQYRIYIYFLLGLRNKVIPIK